MLFSFEPSNSTKPELSVSSSSLHPCSRHNKPLQGVSDFFNCLIIVRATVVHPVQIAVLKDRVIRTGVTFPWLAGHKGHILRTSAREQTARRRRSSCRSESHRRTVPAANRYRESEPKANSTRCSRRRSKSNRAKVSWQPREGKAKEDCGQRDLQRRMMQAMHESPLMRTHQFSRMRMDRE